MVKINFKKFCMDHCFFGWNIVREAIILDPDGNIYHWRRYRDSNRFKPISKKKCGYVEEDGFYIWYE